MKAPVGPIVAGLVCVFANYAVALFILYSKWGSAFMMDDQFDTSNVVVPVAAGLVLGCIQTVLFGSRVTLFVALVGLSGVLTVLLAYTLLTQAAGIVAGSLTVVAVQAAWRQPHPSDSARPT